MNDLERVIAGGGVALFPADTVYGLACDPQSEPAVRRLYEIKGRPPDRPAAVMFFQLAPALAALPQLGPRTRSPISRAAEAEMPSSGSAISAARSTCMASAIISSASSLGVSQPAAASAVVAASTASFTDATAINR